MAGDWQSNKYEVKPLPPGFDPMNDVMDDQARSVHAACSGALESRTDLFCPGRLGGSASVGPPRRPVTCFRIRPA